MGGEIVLEEAGLHGSDDRVGRGGVQTEIEHGVHFDGYNLAGARVDCEVEAVHHVVSMFSRPVLGICGREVTIALGCRSEEHTSELQSLMRISYAVFCLKKKK